MLDEVFDDHQCFQDKILSLNDAGNVEIRFNTFNNIALNQVPNAEASPSIIEYVQMPLNYALNAGTDIALNDGAGPSKIPDLKNAAATKLNHGCELHMIYELCYT